MPVESLDQIFARLSADERKLFDNVIAREPELKKGWLRQDEFSRNMNDLNSKQKEFDELRAYQDRMKPWSEQAHERIKAAEAAGIMDAEGKPLWQQKEEEYKRQIAAAAVGGEMDPKELDKRVREIVADAGGNLTREEIKALFSAEGAKMVTETFDAKYKEAETTFNTKTIPTVAGFSAGVAVLAGKYERETGEAWTEEKAKELFELMSKEQNFNAYQVGDKMIAPFRDRKAREAEIKAEAQKLADRMLAERGLPGGGDERYTPHIHSEQKGALQAMLERSGDPAAGGGNNGAPGGDLETMIKSQAVKAGQALREEGKF